MASQAPCHRVPTIFWATHVGALFPLHWTDRHIAIEGEPRRTQQSVQQSYDIYCIYLPRSLHHLNYLVEVHSRMPITEVPQRNSWLNYLESTLKKCSQEQASRHECQRVKKSSSTTLDLVEALLLVNPSGVLAQLSLLFARKTSSQVLLVIKWYGCS